MPGTKWLKSRETAVPSHFLPYEVQPTALVVFERNGPVIFANRLMKQLVSDLQSMPENFSFIGCNYFELHPVQSLNQIENYQEEISIGSEILDVKIRAFPGNKKWLVGYWERMTEIRNQSVLNNILKNQLDFYSASFKNINRDMTEISQNIRLMTDKTSQSMKELSVFLKYVGEYTVLLNNLVQESRDVFDDILRNSNTSRELNKNVQEKAHHTVKLMEALNADAELIQGMAGKIESLMDQSNILSLNALIEAGKAGGEVGDRFKVIANNIKNFSSNTTGVADNIREYILNSLGHTNSATEQLNQVLQFIHKLHDFSGETDQKIIGQISNMEKLLQRLSSQSDGAQRDTEKLMAKVKELTQQSEKLTAYTDNSIKILEQFDDMSESFQLLSERLGSHLVLQPSDVYRLVIMLNEMIDTHIAIQYPSHISEKLLALHPLVYQDKKPEDVILMAKEIAYLVEREFELSSGELCLPFGEVTPTQVFRFFAGLVAEVESKISAYENIDLHKFKRIPPFKGKTPNDVFGMVEMIGKKLQGVKAFTSH